MGAIIYIYTYTFFWKTIFALCEQNRLVAIFTFLFLILLSFCYQPLPAEEEKELQQTLKEILPNAKSVKVEQKVYADCLKKVLGEFHIRGSSLFAVLRGVVFSSKVFTESSYQVEYSSLATFVLLLS